MDERDTQLARIRQLEAELESRDQLEAELRESAARLDSIARNAPDYILEMDPGGLITFMNRPAPGHKLADMLGSSVKRWMEPHNHAAFDEALGTVIQRGEPASYESVGSVSGRHYLNRISPVGARGRVERAILVTHDITELKATERRLKESEEWLRSLVDGYLHPLTISEDGRVLDSNEAFAELLGYSRAEVLGKTALDFTTPESGARVMEHIRSGATEAYEVVAVRKNGSQFPCEIHGKSLVRHGRSARLTVFRDLTASHRAADERMRLEQQMYNTQKLETLGVLAGGIAHDFNNLLQVILGNVDLLEQELNRGAPPEATQAPLAHARAAAVRASEIVHQILAFSGKSPRVVEQVDVGDVVREISELLLVSISKNTRLELDLPDGISRTPVDPTQLRQVLLNLITNASESLGGRTGKVTLRVGQTQLSPTERSSLAVAAPNLPDQVVLVAVSDEGSGMTDSDIQRIFDPFYSTKFTGRGLGLASVAGIVRAHGGAIRVTSTPARGSTFTVYLPKVDAAQVVPTSEPLRESSPPRLAGHALCADDEPRLLEVLERSLSNAGLRVTRAADGEAALAAFRATPAEFDVVVLDLTMPRLGGLEALKRMRETRAELPALLLSGFSDAGLELETDQSTTRFLGKPFRLEALLTSIAELLKRRADPKRTAG